MAQQPTIALITDFGHEDWFVGTMHGVISRIAPKVKLVDLCHNIPPQNIQAASFVLDCAHRYFPDRTIFCCVVDPGVGTERNVICATNGRCVFVAPDNGLLSRVAYRAGDDWSIWRVTNKRYFLPSVSATFQGRDVFAPLAAHLAVNVPLSKIGVLTDSMVQYPIKEPQPSNRSSELEAEVIYVDRFGNIVTNIEKQHLKHLPPPLKLPLEWQIFINGHEITGLSNTFGERQTGEPLFYWGSSGYLEIAINQGRAESELGAEIGSPIRLIY